MKKNTDTNERIYEAFRLALFEKNYSDIRIQDILDFSGVSRSTFYAHYKTKEDVLKSVCTDIFGHVFSHTLKEERSHDFSKSSLFDYKHFITHLFYHLHDQKELMHAIFRSEGRGIFFDYIRSMFHDFSDALVNQGFVERKDVPPSLHAAFVIESFILTVKYWDDTGFLETPERLTEYFLSLNS